MSLIKHDPYKTTSLFSKNSDFDNLIQGFFHPIANTEYFGKKVPAVNIDESDDRYQVSAEMPGFDKEDIEVKFQDGVLAIKAQHKEEIKREQQGNVLNERHYESFYRSFNFGNNVAENDMTAKYDKGILNLTIPKMQLAESKSILVDIK